MRAFEGVFILLCSCTNFRGFWPRAVSFVTPETLNLDSNFLEGPMPTELGLIPSMVELLLGTNFLTGSIPTELGLLFNLAIFELQFNAGMNGSIPAEVLSLFLQNLRNLNVTGTGILVDGETRAPSTESTGSPVVDPTPTTDTPAPTITVSDP
jgi:hypothetical protein